MATKEMSSLYRRLAAVAIPQSGKFNNINNSHISVRVELSSQDPTLEKNVVYSRSFNCHKSDSSDDWSVYGNESELLNSQILYDISDQNGSSRAVFIKESGKSGGDSDDCCYRVHIWSDGMFEKCIDLTSKELHGAVYDSAAGLAHCSWSYNSGHLLYLAERKQPKKQSFFKSSKPKEDDGIEEDNMGDKFLVDNNWGEQLNTRCHSVLCTLDVDSEVISVLDDGIPDNIFPVDPRWAPDDSGIVFVGLELAAYNLGLIYCQQRHSCIYYLDFASGVLKVLGHDKRSVSSPRFSPCGSKLVWLENNCGGPHSQCQRLIQCDWPSREIRTVIEIVKQAGDTGFPGIYCKSLPNRCWSSDSNFVVFGSSVRSKNKIIVVNIDRKLGEYVPVPEFIGSATILDYHQDWLLAAFSSPTTPPYLVMVKLSTSKLGSSSLNWIRLTHPETVEGMAWQIIKHTPTLAHPDFGNQIFESVFVYPDVIEPTQRKEHLPLILMPHGGPHAVFPADFMKYVCGFVQCGYACLLVNYRGSIGFGRNFILSLMGRIGGQDVSDCMDALGDVLQSDEFSIDRDKVVVMGGSHGGFLSGHLIGQHPEVFKAAILRNPVINLVSMSVTSDIPDWVYEEVGVDYSHGKVLDSLTMDAMLKRSPIYYVNQVTAPAMIMLGAKDMRCPPSQGTEFYRALKARGRTTKLLCYPQDAHPIISPEAAGDAFVNVINWFNQHTDFTRDSIVTKCFHSHDVAAAAAAVVELALDNSN